MRIAISFLLVAAVVAGPAAAAADAPAGPLGNAVRPLAYRLELTILPEQAEFSGVTEIDVDIAAPTAVIWLHGNDLEVSGAELTMQSGARHAARYAQVDGTGVASLTLAAPVPAGRATLRLAYTAPFRTGAEGLYHTALDGASYAFTQFEPIDARRMFPGFDEPLFKVPFDVAVTTRAVNAVIGNAPVRAEKQLDDGMKRVEFETTKPLPTYLIALAVGPLDVVEGRPLPPNKVRDRPLPLRAVATRGKGPKLAYALANTEVIVTFLEEYFGVAFPYPKLDLIASPEFGTGGMENAGAIIYGDARLLLTEDASVEQRRGFGGIHAHELAHQWFGDLVTPKWWDDIWLNESFANWMGFKAGAAWKPELHFDVIPALQLPGATELDSRIAARQIRQPVTRNQDIAGSFDAITYLKGGAVLGMFESWLGEDAFRAGIRAHMQRFPHGVADVEDFMASLAQGSKRADVVLAFRSFIDQPGVPLVRAGLDCGMGEAKLVLAQSRYLPLGSRGDPERAWQVPVCVRLGDATAASRQCALMTARDMTLRLPSGACPTFVMPNADGAGYYRFALDEGGWRALMTNFARLNEKEALAAADSLSAAYQANRVSTESFVAAVRTIAGTAPPQVATAPGPDLIRMRDHLAPAGARDAVRALMRELYRPRLDALGPAGSTPAISAAAVDKALLRTKLIRLLALDAEDRELRATLAADAKRYIRMGEAGAGLDESAVNPALTEIALRAGVRELGAPFAEALISRMLASSDVQFRTQAAVALGETDDAALGERVRKLLLDPGLRGREPTTVAFALAVRPSQRRATFDWFKANHEAFIGRLSHFAYRWLPRLGAGFCTLPERDELRDFFAPIVGRLDGADRTLAETLEGIELCAALADAKRGEVDRYFARPEGT